MAKKQATHAPMTAGNLDDIIRDAILRHLYDVHRNARSPKSAGQGFVISVPHSRPATDSSNRKSAATSTTWFKRAGSAKSSRNYPSSHRAARNDHKSK